MSRKRRLEHPTTAVPALCRQGDKAVRIDGKAGWNIVRKNPDMGYRSDVEFVVAVYSPTGDGPFDVYLAGESMVKRLARQAGRDECYVGPLSDLWENELDLPTRDGR